jgi:hypothetical protein
LALARVLLERDAFKAWSAIVFGSVGGLVTFFFDPPAWSLKGKEQRRNAS